MTVTLIVPEWTTEDRLIKARKLTRTTHEGFAKLIGVSTDTVKRYEKGSTKRQKSTMLAWAMAAGVDPVWLEFGTTTLSDEDEDTRRYFAEAA